MAADGGADVEAMARDKLVSVRVTAASSANVTAAVLAGLAADPSPKVRRVVAARPGTPADALTALASDPDRATRQAVAANVSTPQDVLVHLSTDSEDAVRWYVTTNPAAGLRVHHAICASADQDVRFVLASRVGLAAEIAERLAGDSARQVRANLAENTDHPAVLHTLLTDPEPDVRAAAARNPSLTTAQRRRLLRDRSARVRTAIVCAMANQGIAIPEDDSLRLAHDRSAVVRYWLAARPGSTRETYEILAQDPDDMVAVAARASLMAPYSRAAHSQAASETYG